MSTNRIAVPSAFVLAVALAALLLPAVAVADDYPTLSQIQSAAADSGWTAGTNPIWRLTWPQKQNRLGLIWPDSTKLHPEPRSTVTPERDLPAAWDWRNVSGRNYVSSVKNQGSCGSCWAFAACGALESVREIHNDTECRIENLSEQFMVSCCKANSGCDGGNPTKTANCLRDTGTVSEACFPYSATDESCDNRCEDWADELRDISAWSWASSYPRFPTLTELKSAVKQAPVWTTLTVYADFYAYKSGVYRHVIGPPLGGHAVLMVGYNDTTRCFICKNSWGTGWGENGYFRVGYSQIPPKGVHFGRWTQNYYVGLVACLPYEFDENSDFDWYSVGGDAKVTGDDQLEPVSFTFPLKYFCNEQLDGTVSTNGWVSMVDYMGGAHWQHSQIPSQDGPPNMVGPLWTDLRTSSTRQSGVYWEDTGDGRFVIEYREMEHFNVPSPPIYETFEVIYYDPAVYPTQTGDAKIKFQYLTHYPDIDYSPGYTVGIENNAQTCGVEYYSNLSPPRSVGKDGHIQLEGFGQRGTPVYDGLAIEFIAIPDGENDVIPMPPDPFAAVHFGGPFVDLYWTNPTEDVNGFSLDFLDGVEITCNGDPVLSELAALGESDEARIREYETGTFDYEIKSYVGSQYSDLATFPVEIPPRTNYHDHDDGSVKLTMTNQGIIGYMDDSHTEGSGFQYGGTSDSWLFTGSLWAGTDTSYALNRDYSADPRADWMLLDGIAENPAFPYVDEELVTAYDDYGHALPKGLAVSQVSMAWDDEPYDDFVIVEYILDLVEGFPDIEDLYVGVFTDWDIPPGSGGANSARSVPMVQLAYMYRDASYPYVGVALLHPEPAVYEPFANLTCIHNPTYVYPNGYLLDRDRFLFLSAGDLEHVVHQSTEESDWSTLVSAGPFDIVGGASKTVAFVMAAGDDYEDLFANVVRAQELYYALPADVPEDEPSGYALELSQNRPNPFNPMTSIRYTLPEPGDVRLAVYDATGRLVSTLVDDHRAAGPHVAAWDSKTDNGVEVASGVYFCRLESGGRTLTRKMVLLK